ncbi:hypothetical protein BC628DRAFT_1506680 [Trametes gibbosa]|nr:hypothetical protein BC628DRAFT_1506680 [Trametes gibbosa]
MVLQHTQNVNKELCGELSRCYRKFQNLKKRIERAPWTLAKQTKKMRSRPLTLNLKEKGIYTANSRKLAHILLRAGCAQRRIGGLIQLLGQSLGVQVRGRMSAHTIRRIAHEGGHASDLQLAYEMSRSLSFTISGDATTNRAVNYEARHILFNLSTPGTPHTSSPLVHNCLLGVDSSLDHTSESQAQGWTSKLGELVRVYNESPLAKRRGEQLDLEGCALKLTGMGGDHAADQIKTHGLIACWKKEMTYRFLARNHLGDKEKASGMLEKLIKDALSAAIQASGGSATWSVLSSEAQVAAYVEQLNAATTQLGKALYEQLPADKKHPLDLFMRLGCAMHKDLNSVKGGNSSMASAWGELRATPPVLLANKENASTLRDVSLDTIAAAASLLSTEDLTAAELRALESSTRGGVKLASLAGALFNHKDNKKGHHDTYAFYFQEIVAAAELLVNRHHYLRFLEVVRDRKEHPGFNHMEENVYRALQDIPSLTELAVLALYGQSVSHHYLRTARVQQNGLKLGMFHQQLKTAAFGGEDWERSEVITAVLELAPQLPHLKDILVAFLKGALRTWERFTTEFAEGGAIDLASDAELDRAYLLPTNDHNEGALGSYRLWSRRFPNGSQAYYNALAKFFRNGTAEFMETHLCTEEDQRHLRRVGHERDSSGHERARRKAHAAHSIAVALQHAEADHEKQEKVDTEMARLCAVDLILDVEALAQLTNWVLDEQLEVYRKREEDPVVPMKTKAKRKQEKLEALEGAIARYRTSFPV